MLDLGKRSAAVRLWNRGSSYAQIARRIEASIADVEGYLTRRRGWPHQIGHNHLEQRLRPRPEPSLPRFSIMEREP
ncbi:MAG: hypothetical protein ACOYLQ_09685 [Hyphomicrobiaceae bacterium]